jgi:hypothetical protein
MSQTSSSTICAQTRMRPTRRLPARLLAGETVVVDPRDRKVFLLNKVGAVVWAGVERGATAGEILDEVVKRFQVGPEQARADVDRFLV